MKISKVDHTRAGVGLSEEETRGMLYQSGKKVYRSDTDVQGHVKKLVRKAQDLYQLFVQTGVKGGQKSKNRNFESRLREYSRVLQKGLLEECKKEGISQDVMVERQLQYLESLPEKVKIRHSGELVRLKELPNESENEGLQKAADQLVYGSLRKSLKRSVSVADGGEPVFLPSVIVRLLKAMGAGKDYVEKYHEIPERELRVFLQTLNEDYTKTKMINSVVKSIESQNVRVQCVDSTSGMRLQLSGADHPEKKYVFAFLKEYAAADQEGKKRQLVHIRQLILLFYCGSEAYRRTLEDDSLEEMWGFGHLLPEAGDMFSEEALELFNRSLELDNRSTEYSKIQIELTETFKRSIAARYRESVKEPGLGDGDRYWLEYIERQCESLLIGRKQLAQMDMSKASLCKKTFSAWVSYIGMKYVDMGKAVFHFAMPEGRDMLTAKRYGEVRPEFAGGLTSFDYERIKAEETLDQRMFSAISFATQNFDRAARTEEVRGKEGHEDILQELDEPKGQDKHNKDKLKLREDAKQRLLWFFGGQGKWVDSDDSYIGICDGKDLTRAIGREINRLRNATFHYTGEWNEELSGKELESREIIRDMFDHEFSQAGNLFRKKYYANNVLMFYPRERVRELMVRLYARPVDRPAQIPAFGNILNKASLKAFDYVKGDPERKLWSSAGNPVEIVEKFKNSLLFMLKEIYYYDFLQDQNLKKRFLDELDQEKQNPDAVKNLQSRIAELDRQGTLSFGELCQGIMTDYNLQNQNGKKMSARSGKNLNQQIYKHFRTLLYVGIRKAFRSYLKEHEEKYGFLRSPKYTENWAENTSEQDFCEGETIHIYDNIKENIETKPLLLSWYTLAHFLNQRQLNHLLGSMKNYQVFLKDIDLRAGLTGNRVNAEFTRKQTEHFEQIWEMLNFCKLFCEQLSHNLEDYFPDEHAYEEYLSRYVAWKKERFSSLKDFCGQKLPEKKEFLHQQFGIYYDGENPVINRNVVLARMYGNDRLLTACMEEKPITSQEIKDLYKREKDLKGTFRKGFCESEEEQNELRGYQNVKNRVELTDLSFLSELINDLYSQLRSWAYLRERDLMYCQLGYHYMALYYGDEGERLPWLDTLRGDGVCIDRGAVLYQIVAMYTWRLPVYGRDMEGAAFPTDAKRSTGFKVSVFYRDYCKKDEDIYNGGLCFFENIKEHDAMTDFRNSIDHFKFEATCSRSILSLYGEMYDRFLKYDPKLRKSVPVILRNTLLRHFIIADLCFTTNGSAGTGGRQMAGLALREGEDGGLRSDILTYKPDGGRKKENMSQSGEKEEPYQIEARSLDFVQMVRKILEYPEK